jgi:uncharacterized cupredoxin-like copper-binding protein
MLVSACSAPAPPPSGTTVLLTLKDFSIQTATSAVPAGEVILQIHNEAPATHEFVVVRSQLPHDELPLASDGLSVDEEQLDAVDEIGQLDTRDTAVMTLHLDPGHYVFFCNLEGHYLGGMSGVLEVTDDAR